jgi:hypothetical protein
MKLFTKGAQLIIIQPKIISGTLYCGGTLYLPSLGGSIFVKTIIRNSYFPVCHPERKTIRGMIFSSIITYTLSKPRRGENIYTKQTANLLQPEPEPESSMHMAMAIK